MLVVARDPSTGGGGGRASRKRTAVERAEIEMPSDIIDPNGRENGPLELTWHTKNRIDEERKSFTLCIVLPSIVKRVKRRLIREQIRGPCTRRVRINNKTFSFQIKHVVVRLLQQVL